MSERRSQHLVNRVQLVTETVDDEICLVDCKINPNAVRTKKISFL